MHPAPHPLALAIALPLMAAWSFVAAVLSALRALDAALAMLLGEPRDFDERGCWS